jgi:hypothetical protein
MSNGMGLAVLIYKQMKMSKTFVWERIKWFVGFDSIINHV